MAKTKRHDCPTPTCYYDAICELCCKFSYILIDIAVHLLLSYFVQNVLLFYAKCKQSEIF